MPVLNLTYDVQNMIDWASTFIIKLAPVLYVMIGISLAFYIAKKILQLIRKRHVD